MRRTSGEHAITAAVGADFWPDVTIRFGEAAEDDNLRVGLSYEVETSKQYRPQPRR